MAKTLNSAPEKTVIFLQKNDEKIIDNFCAKDYTTKRRNGNRRMTGMKLFENFFEASKKVLDIDVSLW